MRKNIAIISAAALIAAICLYSITLTKRFYNNPIMPQLETEIEAVHCVQNSGQEADVNIVNPN